MLMVCPQNATGVQIQMYCRCIGPVKHYFCTHKYNWL